jgi:hypothetical protein
MTISGEREWLLPRWFAFTSLPGHAQMRRRRDGSIPFVRQRGQGCGLPAAMDLRLYPLRATLVVRCLVTHTSPGSDST